MFRAWCFVWMHIGISAYQCISCGDRAAPENARVFSRFVCAGDHGSGRCVPLLEPLCRTGPGGDLLGNQSVGASWMAALEAPTAFAIASCGQDVVGAFVPHSSVETCRRPTASPWPRRPWFLCVVGVLGHYDHWPTWILQARRDGYDKADWTTSESLDCRVQGSNMFAVDGPLLEGNHVLEYFEWAWGIHLVSNPNLWIHKFTLEILLALIDIDVKSRYNPARDFWLADDKAWSALAVHRTRIAMIALSTIPPPLINTDNNSAAGFVHLEASWVGGRHPLASPYSM